MKRALATTACAGLVFTAAPAAADIAPESFPSPGEVGVALGVTGAWTQTQYEPDSGRDVVGARPSNCRSDRPFRDATEYQLATYETDATSDTELFASIIQYRFTSSGRAKKSLKRVRATVKRCPKFTEWVCTECDGIADYRQKLSAIRQVGDRTVAYAGKSRSVLGSRYRTAVVRDGRRVFEVVLRVTSLDISPVYPTAGPSKRQLRRLAEVTYLAG